MKTAILILAASAAAFADDDSNRPRWRGPLDNEEYGDPSNYLERARESQRQSRTTRWAA